MNPMTRSRLLGAGAVLFAGLAATAGVTPRSPGNEPTASLIRILPLQIEAAKGRAQVETLVLETRVKTVVFYLDGQPVERRRSPPFAASLHLALPLRPQIIRVEALDDQDRQIGRDEVEVNRIRRPLRVDIRSVEPATDGFRVRAAVSFPDELAAERVVVELNQQRITTVNPASLTNGELEVTVARPQPSPRDFVRVALQLADGRQIEDVELVDAPTFHADIAVHLVQLQVVVTQKSGQVVNDLLLEDFKLREGGVEKPVAGLFRADDVSLVLGLAVDSSGSMAPIWSQTRQAAQLFIRQTLTDRDRGFLVDFDTDLRLRQGITGDLQSLLRALDDVEPQGGTALYDSILFALLQFERQPGRRGLVVLTDGFDSQSLTDPEWTVAVGRQLGVPVYVIALEQRRDRAAGGSFGGPAQEVQTLHLVTDPTGGRLFRSPNLEAARRALQQIQHELREQVVLTYYSDLDPAAPLPAIEVRVPSRKGLEVKTVVGRDQID